MKIEIPMIIKRCLTFGIKIYPYKLDTILRMSEKYKIPDHSLTSLKAPELKQYVDGLFLSGQEGAGDWSKGHKILESLGFERSERVEGHRSFVSLKWGITK